MQPLQSEGCSLILGLNRCSSFHMALVCGQCMLRESDGQLVSVADRRERFVLGELKEELGMAIGLNTEAPGSTAFFLRRGFRVRTAVHLVCISSSSEALAGRA